MNLTDWLANLSRNFKVSQREAVEETVGSGCEKGRLFCQ
jgi:hypothetical protein